MRARGSRLVAARWLSAHTKARPDSSICSLLSSRSDGGFRDESQSRLRLRAQAHGLRRLDAALRTRFLLRFGGSLAPGRRVRRDRSKEKTKGQSGVEPPHFKRGAAAFQNMECGGSTPLCVLALFGVRGSLASG